VRPYLSLRRRADFARVRRRGRRIEGAHCSIVAVPLRGGGPPHVALVTTKAIGGAVERNRARRRLRAALEAAGVGSNPYEMIVTARISALKAPFGDLSADVRDALARLGG
jgi:ribonuclease P protein component